MPLSTLQKAAYVYGKARKTGTQSMMAKEFIRENIGKLGKSKAFRDTVKSLYKGARQGTLAGSAKIGPMVAGTALAGAAIAGATAIQHAKQKTLRMIEGYARDTAKRQDELTQAARRQRTMRGSRPTRIRKGE
jgi:hypothetical protein